MKQNPIQNTTSAILLKLSFRLSFKSLKRDLNFDFFRFFLWNIPLFSEKKIENYRKMPPLGRSIGFRHGSGSTLTTRWCFFENCFGFLLSPFISFITLSPISKYLKSAIFLSFLVLNYSILMCFKYYQKGTCCLLRCFIQKWRINRGTIPWELINSFQHPVKSLVKQNDSSLV